MYSVGCKDPETACTSVCRVRVEFPNTSKNGSHTAADTPNDATVAPTQLPTHFKNDCLLRCCEVLKVFFCNCLEFT
jgi:hypothetical protein